MKWRIEAVVTKYPDQSECSFSLTYVGDETGLETVLDAITRTAISAGATVTATPTQAMAICRNAAECEDADYCLHSVKHALCDDCKDDCLARNNGCVEVPDEMEEKRHV